MENLITTTNGNTEQKFSSVYLTEQINIFRKQEGKSVLAHKSLLAKIEIEFSEEIGEQNILPSSYLDKSNRQSKCYEFNYDDSVQLLMSESKTVRKAVIAEMKRLKAKELPATEESMLLHLFPNSDSNLVLLTANTIREKKQALDLLEKKEEILVLQREVIEVNAPLVEFAKEISSSEDCILIGEFAKITNKELKLGRNNLFKKLRELKILDRDNSPYQKHLDAGHFEVKETSYKVGEASGFKLSVTTMVTPSGQQYLLKRLKKEISKVIKNENDISNYLTKVN